MNGTVMSLELDDALTRLNHVVQGLALFGDVG